MNLREAIFYRGHPASLIPQLSVNKDRERRRPSSKFKSPRSSPRISRFNSRRSVSRHLFINKLPNHLFLIAPYARSFILLSLQFTCPRVGPQVIRNPNSSPSQACRNIVSWRRELHNEDCSRMLLHSRELDLLSQGKIWALG
jgi:hypothetical protein